MNYGNKIAQLRKEKKFTQAELGARLNVTAQAVSKWENNLSEPALDSIRKMCELFGVSVDDFLGLPAPEKIPNEEIQPEKIRIISGYCEKCGKPVSPNEYEITHLHYDEKSADIDETFNQHIYCNECLSEIKEKQREQEVAKEQARKDFVYREKTKQFNRGFIWGAIVCVIINIIVWLVYASLENKPTYLLICSVLLAVGSFTLTAQIFWDSWIAYTFAFFCRSFTVPFGFIFSFDLDGFIWFISVKLVCSIICGLLSTAVFLLGLAFCLPASIINFGFSLSANLSKIDDIKNS